MFMAPKKLLRILATMVVLIGLSALPALANCLLPPTGTLKCDGTGSVHVGAICLGSQPPNSYEIKFQIMVGSTLEPLVTVPVIFTGTFSCPGGDGNNAFSKDVPVNLGAPLPAGTSALSGTADLFDNGSSVGSGSNSFCDSISPGSGQPQTITFTPSSVTCACSTATLTWGYWKRHTGSFRPRQDPTYHNLSTTCPAVNGTGAISLDGDCDNSGDSFKPTVVTCAKSTTCGAQSADALFAGGNTGSQPNCSGDCVSLFAAQLLAAELNNVKSNGALAVSTYNNPSDPSFNGKTVGQILNSMQTAFDVYVDGGSISCGGASGTFEACQDTLDAINNSSESTHVLSCQ